MKKTVIYIHGKGGNAEEAEHYMSLFPDCEVVGFDYKAGTPWEAKSEFADFFRRYEEIILIANSIGAYFAMCAGHSENVKEAFFISPVVNMERLISQMMTWAGVTEAELEEKKIIETPFGETLSWEYLCYAGNNPIKWNVPTHILYGENDNLTSLETVRDFTEKTGATLEVMPGGEHWFHTEEQMKYLDGWIRGKYMIIKTERLTVRLSTDDEMRFLIDSETDEEMKKAYGEMLAGCVSEPEKRQWYAAWFIEAEGERIGDLCFKGISPDGTVEIGYGLLPEYWGCGYATEAVKAMVEWAEKQPGVRRIEAETEEDNRASQRVLLKAGFVPTGENGEEGPRFVRRIFTSCR